MPMYPEEWPQRILTRKSGVSLAALPFASSTDKTRQKLERTKLANTPRKDTDVVSDGHESREEDDGRKHIEEERRGEEVAVFLAYQLEGSAEQRSIYQPVKDETGSCIRVAEDRGDAVR
jgi:hypothetical protein